jgi:hypothetical protein
MLRMTAISNEFLRKKLAIFLKINVVIFGKNGSILMQKRQFLSIFCGNLEIRNIDPLCPCHPPTTHARMLTMLQGKNHRRLHLN